MRHKLGELHTAAVDLKEFIPEELQKSIRVTPLSFCSVLLVLSDNAADVSSALPNILERDKGPELEAHLAAVQADMGDSATPEQALSLLQHRVHLELYLAHAAIDSYCNWHMPG